MSLIMTCYNYILFYLIFYHYLFLKIESFTPVGRLAHSSALAGNKLYFFGGVIVVLPYGSTMFNEVFYLDVSQPFNMAEPQWYDLTPNSRIPFQSSWGTTSSSSDEQTIYLFGGST